jgi:EmrB/QacA subfamily drug resistance transporter
VTEARERLITTVMLGVASGAILVPLNSSMLAVALPGVMDEFGLAAGRVTSLVSLYLGTVAIVLPMAGSLGDRFGARRTFLIGIVGFGGGSVIAAIAPTFEVLELGRVLQAGSGALVSTSSAALIRQTAPAARRGEAFGLFDLLVSTSAALGPFVGGVIVGLFSWRAMFLLAVPLALLAVVVVVFLVRLPDAGRQRSTDAASSPRPIDLPGLTLLALAIAAFLVALGAIGGADTTGRVVAGVAIVPLLGAFVVVELRHHHPAVDPRLFRQPVFAAAVAGVFGSTLVLHGSFILVPLLVERLLHETAMTSGVVLLGVAGVGAIVSPFGGRISDQRGRRGVVVVGSLVGGVAFALMALPASIASAGVVAILLGVVGFGSGLTSPRQAAALESVESSRVGMAAGTYYTGRYLGGVVGASLAGALLGSSVTAAGMSLGFAILAGVMLAVAVASLGLPGRRSVAPA